MTPQRRGPGPSGGSPGHSESWLPSPSWFLPRHSAVCRPGQQAEPGQCLRFLRACRGHPLLQMSWPSADFPSRWPPSLFPDPPAGVACSLPHLVLRLARCSPAAPASSRALQGSAPHDLAPHGAGGGAPADGPCSLQGSCQLIRSASPGPTSFTCQTYKALTGVPAPPGCKGSPGQPSMGSCLMSPFPSWRLRA